MNQHGSDISVSDVTLERFLLQELDEEEMARVSRLLKEHDSLRERLNALSRSTQEIHKTYPAPWMASQIQGKLRERSLQQPRSAPWTLRMKKQWSPALAVMGLAAILVIGILPEREEPGDEVRIKGPPGELRLHRKTDSGSMRLQSGAKVKAGDQVLLQYRIQQNVYGVILSLDGNGTLTRHFPVAREETAGSLQSGTHSLDFAYELDDAPHWEVFFLFTGAASFSVESVTKTILQSFLVEDSPQDVELSTTAFESISLPPGISLEPFVLIKEAAHEN